jgi:hypothetical protein
MARTAIKPNINPKLLTTNPFSLNSDFIIKTRGVETSQEIISKKDLTDGIILKKPSVVFSAFFAERETHSKLYTTSCHRKRIMALPPRAMSLFLFITYELETGVDWLWINKDRYLDESMTNIVTYKSAIEDLTRYGVITPTIYQDTYWINPMLIFAGNRMKKYPNRVIEVD